MNSWLVQDIMDVLGESVLRSNSTNEKNFRPSWVFIWGRWRIIIRSAAHTLTVEESRCLNGKSSDPYGRSAHLNELLSSIPHRSNLASTFSVKDLSRIKRWFFVWLGLDCGNCRERNVLYMELSLLIHFGIQLLLSCPNPNQHSVIQMGGYEDMKTPVYCSVNTNNVKQSISPISPLKTTSIDSSHPQISARRQYAHLQSARSK